MLWFLHWAYEQRSKVTLTLAIMLFVVCLVLRYGFDRWWPAGIVAATLLGIYSLFNGVSE